MNIRPKTSSRDELAALAELCCRAFGSAPHIQAFFPDAARRAQDARALFRMRIRYGFNYGRVETCADRQGLAVWIPARAAAMSTWGQMRSGGLGLYRAVGKDAVARMACVSEHNEQLRQNTASCDHTVLSLLAVDPDHQGRGFGRGLVEPSLHRHRSLGQGVYAETTDPDVLDFYRGLGFCVGDASVVPGLELKVWPLWFGGRKP